MTSRVSLSDPRSISKQGVSYIFRFAGARHVFSFSTPISCPYSPVARQVKSNEGEDLAKINKAAWVETSAKNDINVGECDSLLRIIFPFSLILSDFKARYLNYVWPKSKSGHPAAATKHQLGINVSLCDNNLSPTPRHLFSC